MLPSMPSPHLTAAPAALLAIARQRAGPGTLTARIAKVITPVATLQDVTVRLEWPDRRKPGDSH